MDQLFEKHILPKLTQYEIDNLTSPIYLKEIDFKTSRNLQAQMFHWRILSNI